jgi:hypothetical protein
LVFWYHAFGPGLFLRRKNPLKIRKINIKNEFFADVGTLNVYAESKSDGDKTAVKRQLWTLDRDQGNEWQIARVSTSFKTNSRIIFEGELLVTTACPLNFLPN